MGGQARPGPCPSAVCKLSGGRENRNDKWYMSNKRAVPFQTGIRATKKVNQRRWLNNLIGGVGKQKKYISRGKLELRSKWHREDKHSEIQGSHFWAEETASAKAFRRREFREKSDWNEKQVEASSFLRLLSPHLFHQTQNLTHLSSLDLEMDPLDRGNWRGFLCLHKLQTDFFISSTELHLGTLIFCVEASLNQTIHKPLFITGEN